MNQIVKHDSSFPVLSGDINNDIDQIIMELGIGALATEIGAARLYLMHASGAYKDAKRQAKACAKCNSELALDTITCIWCESNELFDTEVQEYQHFKDFLDYVGEKTGKSRNHLYGRIFTYRVLCDQRGVARDLVLELNLLSSGAAMRLAKADPSDPNISLENNSWHDTVKAAISYGTKAGALEYVRRDVLSEPRITAHSAGSGTIIICVEYQGNESLVIDQFTLVLNGNWSKVPREWLQRRLNIKD